MRADIHEFTEAEIRFILILRHVAASQNCWKSIAKAFNEAFGTDLNVRCLNRRYQKERQLEKPFFQYLVQNNTVPPEFEDEYQEILRRFGRPERQGQGARSRYAYSPVQLRFIAILANLTKNEPCMKWKRWAGIAAFYNDYFKDQITKEAMCSRWTRSQKVNDTFVQSLEETGRVPDEFLQEYENILEVYYNNREKYFPGVSGSSKSRLACSSLHRDSPAPIIDGKMQFLILLEHFSLKNWEEITDSFNHEFNMCYSQVSLFQYFETERPKYPLYHTLQEGGFVPQELVEYRDFILNKYGAGNGMQPLECLTCDETSLDQHSGSVHLCVGIHDANYNVCESCKIAAIKILSVLSRMDLEVDLSLGEKMDFTNEIICEEQGKEWLCLGCRLQKPPAAEGTRTMENENLDLRWEDFLCDEI